MNETLLSWYQALQLLALGPCLFMMFFLLVAGRKAGQILVPLLYFLSLACGFLLPLREAAGWKEWTHTALLLGASAEPALSFLLIVQFVSGNFPKLIYWTILCVPFVGGGQIVHATAVTEKTVCIFEHVCAEPQTLRKLYDIFSISLGCLLALAVYRRLGRQSVQAPNWQIQQKYALVLALIMLNLILLVVDLAQITGYAELDQVRMAETVVRIGFIYLVLTLIFRVFDRTVELAYERVPSMKPAEPSERDQTVAGRIRELFVQEKLFRDMELDRLTLARKLAVTEATLSRVVNQCFGENVSMMINRYRVEEAQRRLRTEPTPITTIAFEVGFSSIPSFNRVFRALSDMSPSEYRAVAKP